MVFDDCFERNIVVRSKTSLSTRLSVWQIVICLLAYNLQCSPNAHFDVEIESESGQSEKESKSKRKRYISTVPIKFNDAE